MRETTKRKWFQFHLSTAVVGMFVAGLTIWANCNVREYEVRANDLIFGTIQQFGWPVTAVEMRTFIEKTKFFPLGLSIDVTVGTCTVLLSMYLAQTIIRLREARKT